VALFAIAIVALAADAVTLDTTILVTLLTVPDAGVRPVKEVEPL
jgi:hypothetical protein